MPTARNVLAVVASSDGRVFAIGGQGIDPVGNFGTNLPDVEAYSTATRSWSTMSRMPIGLTHPAAASDGSGRIYVAGGVTGVYPDNVISDALQIYDEGTNTWFMGTTMPTARYSAGAAFGSDGRMYVIGGNAGTDPVSVRTNEAFDPRTQSWQQAAPMPTGRRGLVAVARDGLIYAIGGWDNGTTLDVVEIYDPATNSWTSGAPIPSRRAWAAGCLGQDGRIYVSGGFDHVTSRFIGTVEAFDPRTNSWETQSGSLSIARANHGMATGADGRMYVVGGEASGVVMIDSVESLRRVGSPRRR